MSSFTCAACHQPVSTSHADRCRCGRCGHTFYTPDAPHVFAVTSNDRRWLRSVRIAADTTNDEAAE